MRIPDIETRICNIEVALEAPRCTAAINMGNLLRKAANREWNQSRRKKFVAVNKDEKGSHGDAEFRVCLAGFLSCFGDNS